MTRTNAENHFATLPSDSVSKWYAASRWALRRLIFQFCCSADDRGRHSNRRLGIFPRGMDIAANFVTSRANFPSQRAQNPAISIPCSINDENSGRTQVATSNVLSIVQNHPSIRNNLPRWPRRRRTSSWGFFLVLSNSLS
jgi:hypothetical protein